MPGWKLLHQGNEAEWSVVSGQWSVVSEAPPVGSGRIRQDPAGAVNTE